MNFSLNYIEYFFIEVDEKEVRYEWHHQNYYGIVNNI